MTGRERRVVLGTKIGQYIEIDDPKMMRAPDALAKFRGQAVAALRIMGVREGLVLDEESVVYEGVVPSMFGTGESLHYTAYAYPHGAIPAPVGAEESR